MPIDKPAPSDPSQGDRQGLVPGTLDGDLTPRDRGQSAAAARDEDRDSDPLDDDGKPKPKTTSIGIQPGDMGNFAHVRPGDVEGDVPDLTDATPAELAATEGVTPDLVTPPGQHLGVANPPEDAPGSTVGTEADDDPERGEGDGERHEPTTDPEDPERFGAGEAVHDDKIEG